jgi:hypothetical protein
MATAAAVVAGIESLGVPWWGWTALVVMIFFGLLVPAGEENLSEPGMPDLGQRRK